MYCSFREFSAGPATFVAADYDLLTGEEASGRLELRISEFAPDSSMVDSNCVLHLNHDQLAECLDAAALEAERHGAPAGEAQTAWRNKLAGLALTMLLYLAGEPTWCESSIRAKGRSRPKSRAPTPSAIVISPNRASRLSARPSHVPLSVWEIDHHDDDTVASGRTMRPHMRRAHSHLYWTGEERKQPRVRFLLPISVHGGKLVEPQETRVGTVR